MDQQKIGQFLRECRKEKGITQEQLAEMLGVTNRSVSRWENGSNLPDLDILIEMADYYDVELTKRMHLLFIGGFVAAVTYMILLFTDRSDNFLGGMCLGITFGMMIVGVLMTSKYAAKIRTYKRKLLHRQ
ncbi:MAG: helix-turn-helix domain-containing protein [Lachnospiraceae bacterium]|nr:helix-turn-helix domain-containing protein [Lachnospiraceae bacterium]MDD7627398.1 helix-turn-helix transcriptional regulator [Lachnospiraceae bacterium]MDY4119510.1 helix-turn-helix transcriptional regulator [Lachnospiraceae bacterium]